jgi:hypothetical protein
MKVDDALSPRSPEAAPEAERPAETKRRRPYAPPAIESGGGFAPITLGTKAPVLPGQGC